MVDARVIASGFEEFSGVDEDRKVNGIIWIDYTEPGRVVAVIDSLYWVT